MAAKKILFLSAWYPTRLDPMPGLFVKRHAEILTNSCQVAALHAIQTNKQTVTYEIEKNYANKVFTVIVYYPKTENTILLISQLLKVWYFIRSYLIGIKEIRKHFGLPDLVHANILTRIGAIALYLKVRYSIPYVITEHWTRYTSERKAFKGFFRKMLAKLVVAKSSGISAVSENLKAAMKNYGINHRNFLIVNNIVYCEMFRPQDNILKDHPKVFAHISCFDNKAKNTNGIVKAIAALSKQRNDFLCLLVGEGPDKPDAEQLAKELGIFNKTVQFTGLLEGSDIIDVYNQSLFTLLFSNYENMPVVISESFACGKPVISTNVGGIPEIVNESNGILISAGNENELTESINYMLDNYTSYDAVQIRNYAIKQFGKEAVIKQLTSLYQKVEQ